MKDEVSYLVIIVESRKDDNLSPATVKIRYQNYSLHIWTDKRYRKYDEMRIRGMASGGFIGHTIASICRSLMTHQECSKNASRD